MTTLGFSYDHRVLDGATADAFCAAVKAHLVLQVTPSGKPKRPAQVAVALSQKGWASRKLFFLTGTTLQFALNCVYYRE